MQACVSVPGLAVHSMPSLVRFNRGVVWRGCVRNIPITTSSPDKCPVCGKSKGLWPDAMVVSRSADCRSPMRRGSWRILSN
eukprot:364831-Chlamydomonas_euryale.AAC.6